MGPPTISADQGHSRGGASGWRIGFNGAADDLGGSSWPPTVLFVRPISSFNGAADDLGGSRGLPSICVSSDLYSFNGAADDLGGSRPLQKKVASVFLASMGPPTISADQGHGAVWRLAHGWASMGPPTISADQACRSAHPTYVEQLQWGRRRSRRIKQPGAA